MPVFELFTNVSKDKIPPNFFKETGNLIAKTLGKPESYVTVRVLPDQLMIWGGTNEPCATANLNSIGCLDTASNKKHSAAISAHLSKNLGIPSDRLYINFVNLDKANVGYSGTTFHGTTFHDLFLE